MIRPNHPALIALAHSPRKADGKVSITALNRLVRTYGPDHGLVVTPSTAGIPWIDQHCSVAATIAVSPP